MDHLTKVISAGICTIVVAFITQWTSVIHTDTLVHPDWSKTVDADARLWSIIIFIILYIVMHNYTRRTLAVIVIVFALISIVLITMCYYFGSTIAGIPKVDVANQVIRIWKWCFVAADAALVSTAAGFGLWLAAK